jgi:aflatoxin B1 aldehyde reductase
MTSKQKSAINIVFGAMTFGNYKEQSRVTSVDDCAAILDIFQKHGHNEIDTARVYGNGSSEEYLAQLKWQERGIIMDTKLYPSKAGGIFTETITHKPEDIRTHFEKSMTALNADKIYMFYLHGPDRSTPYEDTLREVNSINNIFK